MTREEAKNYLENYRKMYASLAPERFLEALDIILSEPSFPSNLDEAAKKIVIQLHPCMEYSSVMGDRLTMGELVELVKAGAKWMAEQGWHDVTETPSIFGFYLVIHEKGWCVANYMGKGTVCESGWVEAIHHIEIEHPQKWLDLRDLIPKKQ